MGTSTSVLDCVHTNDFEALKETLESEKLRLAKDQLSDEEIDAIHLEMEESLQTIVGMEINSSRQLQRLQIALELMLNAFPHLLQAHASTECKWTSIHRICVAENLQFVDFLVSKFKSVPQQRDAFGLFPVDLIAPELFLQPKHQVRHSVQLLLEGKRQQEAKLLQESLQQLETNKKQKNKKSSDPENEVDASSNQPEDQCDNADSGSFSTLRVQTGEYYVAFLDMSHLSNQRQLSASSTTSSSRDWVALDRVWKHDADTPLLLAYRLPRVEEFMNGYFQLIWRSCDEPRLGEPHYDLHYMLREDIQDVDVLHEDVMVDADESIQGNQEETRESNPSDGKQSTNGVVQRQRVRSLDEESCDVLEGALPIEVSHLPHEATVHVLFVACDKQMMKRHVELTTEGICIQRLTKSECESDSSQETGEQHSEYGSFVFYVAGEEFSHSSPELAGQMFETLEEFQTFVKDLRRVKNEGSSRSSLSSPVSASPVSRASSVAPNNQESCPEDPVVPETLPVVIHGETQQEHAARITTKDGNGHEVPRVFPRAKVDLNETIMIA